jgi:hypothetical protein
MRRNPHPHSIEELEHDDSVFGPAPRKEEHRMLTELSTMHLRAGVDHIQRSRALLARLAAKFPARPSGQQRRV